MSVHIYLVRKKLESGNTGNKYIVNSINLLSLPSTRSIFDQSELSLHVGLDEGVSGTTSDNVI